MATLKQILGEAGAAIDESNGMDRLYDVLLVLAQQVNDFAEQFNLLLADYNAETLADHTTSSASALTEDAITIE